MRSRVKEVELERDVSWDRQRSFLSHKLNCGNLALSFVARVEWETGAHQAGRVYSRDLVELVESTLSVEANIWQYFFVTAQVRARDRCYNVDVWFFGPTRLQAKRRLDPFQSVLVWYGRAIITSPMSTNLCLLVKGRNGCRPMRGDLEYLVSYKGGEEVCILRSRRQAIPVLRDAITFT